MSVLQSRVTQIDIGMIFNLPGATARACEILGYPTWQSRRRLARSLATLLGNLGEECERPVAEECERPVAEECERPVAEECERPVAE